MATNPQNTECRRLQPFGLFHKDSERPPLCRCPSQTSTPVNVQPDASLVESSAQTRAEKITAAIVPDQLDHYMSDGMNEADQERELGRPLRPNAPGPSSPSTFPSDGA